MMFDMLHVISICVIAFVISALVMAIFAFTILTVFALLKPHLVHVFHSWKNFINGRCGKDML